MADKLVTDEIRATLRESFKDLTEDVHLLVFTGGGANETFDRTTVELVKGIAGTSKRLKASFLDLKGPEAKKYGVNRSPTILISPKKYDIRFTGAPLGEEGRSLVMSIIMASTGKSLLTEESRRRLGRLKEERHVRVFVSPTCPYCPQQFLYAVSAAIEKPGLVRAESIEIFENRDLARKYSAMSVPKTLVGEEATSQGLEPEANFIASLIEGKHVDYVMPEGTEDLRDFDVVVLGGGPAGLTAAIYAERSGLRTVILEQGNVGGQVAITPIVENYPGFARVEGKVLVEMMSQQAAQYAPIVQGTGASKITKAKEGAFEIATARGAYRARAVILATGATNRKLGVKGEKALGGRGVSYCSTCDGYLFKDGRDVVVIGGGNTALTDALYLDSIGARVTVVHRSKALRAQERLQQSLRQRDIPVLLSHEVLRILGDAVVSGVELKDLRSGEQRNLKADAVFIAIGYVPNSGAAADLGLKTDAGGYIVVDRAQRTGVPFVYAAGDVTGGVKQIAVAAGQGSVAAISAFEDLADPYWAKKGKK